ncbi:CsgG/HfaB family protein [Acinetobacter ihumii]|uniref:CsgG/HfaB family protein n=1 Tax=Acinetobacter ihumii TaxID=2483802 RepID=UPI00102FAEE7|nr:CsgG/HfaB family protein [Acinetobacter ihumii]
MLILPHVNWLTKIKATVVIAITGQVLTACTGIAVSNKEPVTLVQGPPITDIFTPFDMALSCLKGQLRNDVNFSVGAILDQTGKDVVTNGGSGKMVTQGAGDMVQSALFQAGVSLLNRRDPRIIESEARWGIRDARQIQSSDYYVTGSINSLDFIPGGGFDIQVGGVGPSYSQTRIIVGLDLALTDTRTSKVIANVSLQKQIAAQDYGVNAGRFAGNTLLNIQLGKGEREATNFALRQMLNFATFDLLTQVIPPATYESCRAQIPKEFGSLNLTRSSVALYKYQQDKLKMNPLTSSPANQDLSKTATTVVVPTDGRVNQKTNGNKNINQPSKDTLPPRQKESELIQNPEGDTGPSKEDIVKYISLQHQKTIIPKSVESVKTTSSKNQSSTSDQDQKKDKQVSVAGLNPDTTENYWIVQDPS